jgi:signal transduction histidine kinase
VFRSLSLSRDPVSGTPTPGLMRVVDIARAATLVAVIATVAAATPHPSLSWGRGLLITIALAITTVAWVVWMLTRGRPRLNLAALITMGVAGGVLAGLSPNSVAVATGCVAAIAAGTNLATLVSMGITAGAIAAYLITGLAASGPAAQLVALSVAVAGMWMVGLSRRAFVARAQQAELVLAETRRAREAETQAAALAERARIAREIHDVLAHSLGAVSVNLQAAEGLLSSQALPAGNPELAKAVDCIQRAATLTRDGLAAARRATLALREDAVPLPDQLSELAGQYRETGDLDVELSVSGEARPLPAEARLAAFRTAQEGLTNVRKHAPGQPVKLSLGFEPAQVTVRVVNPLPNGGGGPLAATGAGYGLTGLRERAELAGGELDAGPADGNWQIVLRIPA